jgi:hypothetical protein
MNRVAFSLAITCVLAVSACATTRQLPADQIGDACRMLKENKTWYKALRQSAKDWGAPMGLQLAIIKQESNFDSKAKPARGDRKLFGLLQGDRPSSAYGYAQALDMTWEQYKSQTGNGGADRHSFRDSVDFIGWYVNQTARQANVGQYDYRAHYLAYHEGAGGYVTGTWRNKQWLVDASNRVQAQAARYESQIATCDGLKRDRFLGIF